LAAAFVVAFTAGFVARGDGKGASSEAVARVQGAVPTARASSNPEQIPMSQRVRLPLLSADSGADQDAFRQSSALPEYVRKQLERQGYEVEGDRQVLSVALEDGRSVAVPVERLKYRYVGYRVH
jgi:hypothetical protein